MPLLLQALLLRTYTLFAASNGLGTVIRAWVGRAAIADALRLTHDQRVLLSQAVEYPKAIP